MNDKPAPKFTLPNIYRMESPRHRRPL